MQVNGQKHLGSGALIVMILLLCFFAPLSTDMFLSDLPNMAVELGTDPTTMNMVLYSFILSFAVSILVFGPLTDKYGRRPVLFFSLVEYTVVSIAGYFVQDVYSLIIVRILQGIGSGAALTVSTALIKDCFAGPTMQKVLNISAVCGIIAPLVAPIAGTAIISVSSWRVTLLAPLVISIACLVMTMFLTETVTAESRSRASVTGNFRQLGTILSDRAFAAFLLMVTVFNGAFMAYLSVSSYIYEVTFGVSQFEYSLFLAAALVGSVILMMGVNHVSARIGKVRSIALFPALMLLSAVLMFVIGGMGSILFLIAFLPCVTVTTSMRPYGMGILMNSRDGDNGLISALINFMMFFTGVIGMVVSTMFPDYIQGLGIIMFVTVVVYVASWLILKRIGYGKIRSLPDDAYD